MLQKSGYGIVIRVLSTSQCSAVLPSQYNPPFLPLQNPQRQSATTYLMNSKRWLFPCLFRVFMIWISVNTQGSVNGRSSSSAAPIAGLGTRFSIDRGQPCILSAIQVKVHIQHLSPTSCCKDSLGSGPETAHFRIFWHSQALLGLPAILGPGSHGVAPTSHAINSIASSSTHTLSLTHTFSLLHTLHLLV